MKTAIIYTYKPASAYEFGHRAAHLLEEPDDSREWITAAEYELPEGYEVAESIESKQCIFDAADNYCELFDATYNPGCPAILDSSASGPKEIHLHKIRDLTWDEAERLTQPAPGKHLWYAYQETEDEREEAAWDGDGTANRSVAESWLRDQYNAGNPAAQVAVISSGTEYGGMPLDTFCEEVITTDDV